MTNANELTTIKARLMAELDGLAARYKLEYNNALDEEQWDSVVKVQQDSAKKFRVVRAAVTEFAKTFEKLAAEGVISSQAVHPPVTAAAPVTAQPHPPVPAQPTQQGNRRVVTVPKSIQLGGRTILVKSWGDLLVQVCEAMIPSHTFEMSSLPDDAEHGDVKIFSYNESDIKNYARKLSNGVWVETKLPSKDVITAAESVLKKCGVPYELIIDAPVA